MTRRGQKDLGFNALRTLLCALGDELRDGRQEEALEALDFGRRTRGLKGRSPGARTVGSIQFWVVRTFRSIQL